jgi:hypothetical protein
MKENKKWKVYDPETVESILLSHGFLTIAKFHDTWNALSDECGYEDKITYYWTECAREIISSFGNGEGIYSNRGRHIGKAGFYRSSLLDSYHEYYLKKRPIAVKNSWDVGTR